MKINATNSFSQTFGNRIVLSPQSKSANYYDSLKKALFEKDVIDENSIYNTAKNYAKAHSIKKVDIYLRKGAENIKCNEQGDLLMVNCGPKTSVMRFGPETSKKEVQKLITGNIQDNYNLMHPRKCKSQTINS